MNRRPPREMRNNPPRLRGAPQERSRVQNPDPPARKLFNCIVDDTALMAGLKKNTRDGIRKWVNMGAIRLFVPLHSLEHLSRLSKGKDRTAADAREALRWLDDITSLPNIESAGTVQLQGPDQTYETWEEVEKLLLPETLLSMEDTDHESDILSAELDSLHLAGESDQGSLSSSQSNENRPATPSSPRSTYSTNSPAILNASPYRPMIPDSPTESADRTARNSIEMKRPEEHTRGGIPPSLRPLFNHVLWLINQEENSDAALANYILLTNDEAKQTLSQRFGVRAKRLEQLRDIIAREDRDYKNRVHLYKKENDVNTQPPVTTPTKPTKPAVEVAPEESASDEEDVILLKPGSRGSAAATSGQRVLDPNEFSRGPTQNTARGGRGGRGAGRGSRGGHRSPALNGPSHNGPRNSNASEPAATPIGRGVPRGPRATADLSKPIDPDSFARPPPASRNVRGGRRKLWEPT